MSSADLMVAALLGSLFDAGWSIQVLLGDADQAQYEASRIARPQIERHLRTMVDAAAALPADVRQEIPQVDWESWVELGGHLPPASRHDRDLVWAAVSAWLPPAGAALRRHRRERPARWRLSL